MKVVYAGSFDPITYGHLDIIYRAQKMFGEVVLAVLHNRNKQGLFTLNERIELLEEVLSDKPGIYIDSFEGLLVDYMTENNYNIIVRGLRSSIDFEFELNLAMANREYDQEVETIFLPSSPKYSFISSSLAREVASFHRDTSIFVPEAVQIALEKKF